MHYLVILVEKFRRNFLANDLRENTVSFRHFDSHHHTHDSLQTKRTSVGEGRGFDNEKQFSRGSSHVTFTNSELEQNENYVYVSLFKPNLLLLYRADNQIITRLRICEVLGRVGSGCLLNVKVLTNQNNLPIVP